MPRCTYCQKEFAAIGLGKGEHDWFRCSEETVQRMREALEQIAYNNRAFVSTLERGDMIELATRTLDS